ncbi:MAG: DUF11 domain-containing protein, partial [Frankiaceae bacterium]|nr:DUF11 domain-containing protein [Frankiaceae bacterium]
MPVQRMRRTVPAMLRRLRRAAVLVSVPALVAGLLVVGAVTAPPAAAAGPALTLTKTATVQLAGGTVTKSVYNAAGDTVTYTFTVTNTGDADLAGVSVLDPMEGLSAISCPGGSPIPSLAKGTSATCTATYTVTAADVSNKSIINTATAAATDPGPPATEVVSAPASYPLTVLHAYNTISTPYTASGGVKITACQSNSSSHFNYSGPAESANIKDVIDGKTSEWDIIPPFWYVVPPSTVPQFYPGQNWFTNEPHKENSPVKDHGIPPTTFTGQQIFNNNCIIASSASSALTIRKTIPGSAGLTINDSFTFNASVDESTIDEDGNPSSVATDLTTTSGGTASTDLTVVGTGSVSSDPLTLLGNVPVTFAITEKLPNSNYTLSGVTCSVGGIQQSSGSGTLNGSTYTLAPFTYTGQAVVCDVTNSPTPGKLTLTKKAAVEDAAGAPLGTTYSAAGDQVNYTFVVANEGTTDLSNITVSDVEFSGAGALSAISCPEGSPIPSLAPGASATCTATYEVSPEDLNAGQILNTATATATAAGPFRQKVDSNRAEAVVTADPFTGLGLAKTAEVFNTEGESSDQRYSAPTDTVTYTFTMTNRGNVPLSGVQISDPLPELSAISCPGTTYPIPSLAAGASAICTATYQVSVADLDAGQILNTAAATANAPNGEEVDSNTVEAVVTADAFTGLGLAKTAVVNGAGTAYRAPGDVVTYTFTVTNRGNVTL